MQPENDVERHLRSLVQTLLDANTTLRGERDRARLDLAAVCVAAGAVLRFHDEHGEVPASLLEPLRGTIERVEA